MNANSVANGIERYSMYDIRSLVKKIVVAMKYEHFISQSKTKIFFSSVHFFQFPHHQYQLPSFATGQTCPLFDQCLDLCTLFTTQNIRR